jgi:hypothetical protein
MGKRGGGGQVDEHRAHLSFTKIIGPKDTFLMIKCSVYKTEMAL